jgi:hypothetical protein
MSPDQRERRIGIARRLEAHSKSSQTRDLINSGRRAEIFCLSGPGVGPFRKAAKPTGGIDADLSHRIVERGVPVWGECGGAGTSNRQGVPAIKDDIAGWTPQLRDRKIDQLASVIAAMNTGQDKNPSRQMKEASARVLTSNPAMVFTG